MVDFTPLVLTWAKQDQILVEEVAIYREDIYDWRGLRTCRR